jgi:RNA polymerase sigma-70 factor (ECF subfamily)
MASSESDAGLIADSLENPVLFSDLFDRHFDPIHSYLARRVGGQVADDLASEVFLQAFKARSRYDGTQLNARPWLYGIASRLLSHHYRDEQRRLLAYARAASEVTVTDSTDEADARTDAAAAAPRLAEALAALAPGDRDALFLFVWGALTYDEVGRALEIPTGTVRSRIHRARRIVRERTGPIGQYQSAGDDVVPRIEGGSHRG